MYVMTGFEVIPNGRNPLFLLILLPILFSRLATKSNEFVANSHITDTYALGLFIYVLHYLNYILYRGAVIHIKNSTIMMIVLITAVLYKLAKRYFKM